MRLRLETRATRAFDLILCDVPCSGTGTLARNPEIRHRLRAEDLPRQAIRQRAILSQALTRLAPGGRLVYATCSLEPEENERVVEEAASAAGVRRLSVAPLIASLADAGILSAGGRRSAGGLRGKPWSAAHTAGHARLRWIFRGDSGAQLIRSDAGLSASVHRRFAVIPHPLPIPVTFCLLAHLKLRR